MNYYAMTVAYDGTDYFGWQIQPGYPTIAGVLQDTFIDVFKRPAVIVGASRTDAGVHAMGQVALYRTELAIDPERMRNALNNRLPTDIIIRTFTAVDDSFHPQRNVFEKTYHYHFSQERLLPTMQRFGWHYRYPFDLDKLKECFSVLIGEHDFRSFCTGDERENTVRTINVMTIDYLPDDRVYQIVVRGQSFLRYMIRRCVGACLEVASCDDLTIKELRHILEARNPAHALPNAPAKGLMLHHIDYKTGEKNE